MGEVLQSWLRDRLGLIVNLKPDNFGLTTRDGTLLAQLLHSYDIIDNAQLKTIIVTEDPALARVNLKHLRIWLKFIGVDCDDDTIEDISNGRGTTAMRLFYKIFVSLESKDKLHFITQQKEREKFIPNSSKFEVTQVLDIPTTTELSENPLARQLIENASVIAWHRNKFEAILDRCKLARARFVAMQKEKTLSVHTELKENFEHEKLAVHADRVSSVEEAIQEVQDFSEKHRVRSPEAYTYHELCNERKYGEQIEPVPVDSKAAKTYVKSMKNRTRQATAIFSCKNRMERELTTKLWDKQKQEQETRFDQAIAKKLFSQSRYEKQMMTKLCEIRDQKQRIARNRGLVDKLIQERTRTERNIEFVREREVIVKEGDDIQSECLRLCELHRRIYEEKVLNIQKKHYQMCSMVLEDLIDISVKAVDYRENNDNFIPAKIWAEWKALFIKSQPIFQTVEHVEDIRESTSKENGEEIFRAEIERQSILNDADFDNYLNVGPPWNGFMPEIDLKTQEVFRLGIIVLGYIVHQLLEYMCPFESDPEPAAVPEVSSACILLGVLDRSVYPIMQTLLKHRGVKLLHMEDAINYCLLCYKQEMKEFAYIDLNTLSSSKDEVQPKNTDDGANSRGRKNTAARKQDTLTKTPKVTNTMTRGIDEATQTPRAIPNEDMSPDLSNPAYIGKWVHEYLTLGQPISNELNTKIIIEYIKSLTNVNGWALVDYPNTFDQMARLETALTGHRIPLDKSNSDEFDDDIEEIRPTFSRISYEAQEPEEFSVFRESRLVRNPIEKSVVTNYKSYMTAYIRALPKPKNMNVDETDIYEILPEDTNPMDAFYTDQGLAYAVYYTSFNIFTLKRLCRLVVGDMSIPRIPSEELFGDGLDSLEDKKDQPPPSKAPIVKQLMPRGNPSNIEWGGESEYEDEGHETLDNVLGVVKNELIPPKPGEDGWKWIRLPQAPMLVEALATLWQNMETVYIEDLKEIFFMKRVQSSNTVPYRDYVEKHMIDFIDRPDIKQDMLHTFHRNYNDIDNDMREDLDVRCELHCRVEDFRKELWEICDERRRQAEDERQRIISQDWTAEEIVVLANLYISIIEAEVNRCIDTVQLIQDYYTSMLQRPINMTRLPKYPLQRLELNSNESAASAPTLSPTIKNNKAPTKVAQSSKPEKNMTSRNPQAAPRIDCSLVKKQIGDSLIDAGNEPFDSAEMVCYQAVHVNVMYVENVVDSVAASVFEALEKEQFSFTRDGKGRVQISKAQLLPTANAELMADVSKRGSDLCEEWGTALRFEINRMQIRLKLLDKAALSDIGSLYEIMKNCFHTILERINDRYNREIQSVNDMASVFCFAIEEGVPIQEELLIDGDRFIIRSNVLMFPDDPTAHPRPIREAILPSQFRMGQLGRLMDVLRYVAPHGSLPERCFTYILEDMVTYREEGGGMAHLPSTWSELRGSDVSDLVAEIFGDSEYIDWREFIIFAMDIPMPSDEEILDARSQFIAMDPNLTEMVTRDQFHSVNMWFSNCNFKDPCCEKLLHEDCQGDEEEMCKVEGRPYSNIEGFTLPSAPFQSDPSSSSKKSYTYSTLSLNSRNMTPQETVRLMLAKELLCDMFAFGCNTVNYTAFLLAFSKDYDPRVGFGKALTLALGEKVCTSEEVGEKFVSESLEQQRHAAAEETTRNYEREVAAKNASSIMNHILENTLDLTEGIMISEINDTLQYDDSIQPMVLEQGRHVRVENLDTGSASNSGRSKPNTAPSLIFASPDSKESDSYEIDHRISTGTILAEGYSKESLGVIGEAVIVHWIPRDVCQSVLVASLPWHARQPDILGTTCCLRECLEKIYADISDETISIEHDYVLSHRLINHEFIINLLNSTTAFTMKHIGNIMQNLLNKRSDLKQTTNSYNN